MRKRMARIHTETAGYQIGDKRCSHGGDESGVKDVSDTGDFDGKKRSGQRRTEDSAERSAHAAHDEHLLFIFLQTELTGEKGTETAADLKSSAFPARGTAAEVREKGG